MRVYQKKKQKFSNSQVNVTPQFQQRPFETRSSTTNQVADLQTLQDQTLQPGFNFAEIPIFASDQSKVLPIVQTKLTIGAPGDKYEQEADRVAHQVVNQINTPQAQSIQREAVPEEKEDTVQTKSINNSLFPQINQLMLKGDTGKTQLEAMPESEEMQRIPMLQCFIYCDKL